MKLQSCTVENFKQYRDRQRIRFAQDPTQNVTVVNGNNGCGKTNLFLSLNWCLYGEGAENVGELMNRAALEDCPIGEKVTTSVEVAFTHKGQPYMAMRKLERIRAEDGWRERAPRFSLIETTPSGDAREIENPDGQMNAILPKNVRTYFLFDGEKIDEFAEAGNQGEVFHAVRNVLDIELLERAQKHLDTCAKEFGKELKALSQGTELEALLEEDSEKRAELEKLNAEVEQLSSERLVAQQHQERIQGKLAQFEESAAFMERKIVLQAERESLQKQQKDLVTNLRSALGKACSVPARRSVRRSISLLDEKRERGEIPSGIRETFIKDLLNKGECICGRPLGAEDDARLHLEGLLDLSVSAEFEDLVIRAYGDLQSLESQRASLRDGVGALLNKRSSLLDQEEAVGAKLDDIERNLEGIQEVSIQGLRAKEQEYAADLMRLAAELGGLQNQVEELRKDLAQIQLQVEKARAKDERAGRLQRQMTLARRSAEEVATIYADFADQMREKIRHNAKEIFQQLIWKEGQWTDMELDTDYALNVLDRYGNAVLPELSAGERQVLSLSFILAMARVAKREAPLVMDTPLGRLSSAHREHIAQYVPGLSEQVVLFVTDEELRGTTRDLIAPFIGCEYQLDFDRTLGVTTVKALSNHG